MSLLQHMVHLYPIKKTLCFELSPVGKTKENFEKNQDVEDSTLASLFLSFDNFNKDKIVEEAQQRSDDFKVIKHLIDPIHIKIIEDNLIRLASDSEFIELLGWYKVFKVDEDYKDYRDLRLRDKKEIKYFICKQKEIQEQKYFIHKQKEIQEQKYFIHKQKEIQKYIINKVKEFLTDNDQFKQIFSDKKIDLLKEYYKDDPANLELISHFANFASYFDNYDNRVRNLYESEEMISTYKSVPYRLITENLPIFYVNTLKFKDITKNIKIVLPDESIKYIDKFSLYLTNSSIKKYNRIIGKINTVISNYNSKHDNKLSHLGKLGFLVDLEQDFDILKRISDDKELVEIINEFINRIKFQNEENIQIFKNMFENLDKKYDINELYIRNNKLVKEIFIDEIREIIREEYSTLDDRKRLYILKQVKFGYIQGSYISFKKLQDKIAIIINKNNINNIIKKEENAEVIKIKNNIKSKIFVAIQNKANKLFDTYLEKYNNAKDILDGDYNVGMKVLESKDVNIAKIKELLDSIKEISDFVSYFIPRNPENKDLLDFYKVNFDIYNKFNPEKLAKINQIYAHVKAYFTLKNFSTKKIRLNFGIESFLNTWDIDKLDESLGTILLKEDAGQTNYFLGLVNRSKFSKFEYVDDTKNVYRQMIYKYASASKNKGKNCKIKFRNISKDCIDKMVEEDELYLFQIYRKDFSKYSNGNLKLHTMYWNNIFDKDNFKKENIFIIGDGARIFYRPKSLERKITHKANEPINNKNVNNSKKESNFKFDLIKDKRYSENKLILQVPIVINCNDKEITQRYFNTIINKRIKEIQRKSKKDKNQEGINIIAVISFEKELLYFVVINLNGDLLDYGPLNQIITKAHNSDDDKDKVITDYKEKLLLKEQEKENANIENNVGKVWKFEKAIKDFLNGYISQAVNEIVKLIKRYNAIVIFEDLESNSEKINSMLDNSLYYKLEKALIAKLSYLSDKHKYAEDKFEEGSTFCGYQLAYYDDEKKFDEKKSDEKQNGIVFYVPTTLTVNIDPITGFMNCFSCNKMFFDSCDVKDFLSRFESIIYDEEKQYYKFVFSYGKFLIGGKRTHFCDFCDYYEYEYEYLKSLYNKEYFEKKDETWIICSYGDRIEKIREKDIKTGKITYLYKKVDITKEFQKLFNYYKIRQGRGLKTNIINFLDKQDKSLVSYLQDKKKTKMPSNKKMSNPKEDFCKEFMRLFKLMIQMKNSDGDINYIISPVEKDGIVYDSRKITSEKQQKSVGCVDESTCRAYNIARKGLMILKEKFKIKMENVAEKNIKNKEETNDSLLLRYINRNKSNINKKVKNKKNSI